MKEYLEFLSEEQTRKYLQDIKEFKKGAKNTLAKHNFKLIDQIIKDNFNNTPYSYNVIFSLGLTGLSNAIDTYDKEKGSFTSYASECIIANINDFLKKFPQTSLKAEGQRFAQTVIKELNLNVTSDQSPRLTNYIIDQFELYSSKQTKEILKLRYGFYERPYLEYQIAEKLKIEISEVIAIVMKYKSQIIKYAARLEITPQAIKSETLREKDVSKNIDGMKNAMQNVESGSVTHAVKDTELDGKKICKGDFIGVYGSSIVSVDKDLPACALSLVESIANEDSEIITIYYGKDITEETAQSLADSVEEAFPDADICLTNGGQSVYHYIISVE